MKKLLFFVLASSAMLGAAGAGPDETERAAVVSVIRKCMKNAEKIDFRADGTARLSAADGTFLGHVRFTKPFAAGSKGFRGPVPVAVFINPQGRIVTVRPLPNREDARFWRRLLQAALFDSWSGFPVKEAAKLEVDGVTGATYSSRGVIGSTRAILRKEEGSDHE